MLIMNRKELWWHKIKGFLYGLALGAILFIPAGYGWHMKSVSTNESVLKTDLANLEIHHQKLVTEHGKWVAVYPDPDQKVKMPAKTKGPK